MPCKTCDLPMFLLRR
jgi:hypothetical protein